MTESKTLLPLLDVQHMAQERQTSDDFFETVLALVALAEEARFQANTYHGDTTTTLISRVALFDFEGLMCE